MEKMKAILLSSLLALPCFASAETTPHITIDNNTSAYGTGKLDFGGCSSNIVKNGVIQPHGSMTLPDQIFMFCPNTCKAHIYMTKNCTGPEVAQVTLSKAKGVTSIVNLDQSHYMLVGSGEHVTINPVG